HLMTCKLGVQKIREPKDALQKLQEMDAEGRVWSQDLLLQVKNGWLQLLDIETKEELESYRLDSIQDIDVASTYSYDSVLSITAQDSGLPGTSTMLFQCQEVGAERLRTSLQRALEEEQEQRGPPLERVLPPEQPYRMNSQHYAPSPSPGPRSRHPSVQEPIQDPSMFPLSPPKGPQFPEDPEGDEEVLNHVLDDIERFMKKVSAQPNANQVKKKKKFGKKKKKEQGGIPETEYVQCFQKIKYSLNLLGKMASRLQDMETTAPDFVHIIFNILSKILDQGPGPGLAAQVISPLLTPKAIDLLQSCLSTPERQLWMDLGESWTTSQANWTGNEPPPYQLTFSDSWAPPQFSDDWAPPQPSSQELSGYQDYVHPRYALTLTLWPREGGASSLRPHSPVILTLSRGGGRSRSGSTSRFAQEKTHSDGFEDHAVMPSSPKPARSALQMQVLYEFEARNPQELTVMQGEVLEVLDQSKRWWLVKNEMGQKGYIPSNILEPVQASPSATLQHVNLRLSSKPAEVTAWLQAENFSPATVRALGLMTGSQLLHMTPGELQMLCPQEAPRVLARLEAVRRTLGVRQPGILALLEMPGALWVGHHLNPSLPSDVPLGTNSGTSEAKARPQARWQL
ncbi:Epidermal growth factor receptor kinase substrate 8-like protein 3, partial [Galemys pyrenaicus]